MLFCVDMKRNLYHLVDVLPNFNKGFRQNPNCIKCGNSIFCMPIYEECIWTYELAEHKFKKIIISNPNHVNAVIQNFWKSGNTLWAVSVGLNQILEINIKHKTVIGYYKITKQREKEVIAESIKIKDRIYIISALRGRIYEFNVLTKEIKINEFSMISGGLRTIIESQGKFWMSGYKKEIYIWNKEKDDFNIIYRFPKDFGIYNFEKRSKKILDCKSKEYNTFAFLTSISIGNYIWYIPFQTNQIIYINKITNVINTVKIENEEENIKSINSREMNCKYVLQYVNKDRYIGLYSIKNQIIFEIDSETLEIRRKNIIIDDTNLKKIYPGWAFRDNIEAERFLYQKMVKTNNKKGNVKMEIGERIYNYIK